MPSSARAARGLLLPRLIPVGDPELDERIGGALEPIEESEQVPPAIEPLERLLMLDRARKGRGGGQRGSVSAGAGPGPHARCAARRGGRPTANCARAAADAGDIARHWEVSLERLQGDHRNLAEATAALGARSTWPNGATGCSRACRSDGATARHRLHRRGRNHHGRSGRRGAAAPRGANAGAEWSCFPALWLANILPDEEWEALGPDERGRGEQTHPQYHLKLLLDRIGVARGEVQRLAGKRACAHRRPCAARAVANAMTAPNSATNGAL